MENIEIKLNDERSLIVETDLDLKTNDTVIVELGDYIEFGRVLGKNNGEIAGKVLRKATEEDISKNKELQSHMREDEQRVLKCVKKAGLELKLVKVLRSFDEKKILIIYTAEDRIDFRQLVRDLASEFHLRVEMRQIGERDEAKILGGCGLCGQEVCCKRFLNQPRQTSIKMAKVQGLSLSTNKVNGACGKLMCCLQYEFQNYCDAMEKLPPIGSTVKTPDGEGEIVFHDLLNELVAVKTSDGDIANINKYTMDDIKVIKAVDKEEITD